MKLSPVFLRVLVSLLFFLPAGCRQKPRPAGRVVKAVPVHANTIRPVVTAGQTRKVPARKQHYTQRELKRFMQALDRRFEKKVPGAPVLVMGYGMEKDGIHVILIYNSPRNRALFKKYYMDGDFLIFEGTRSPGKVTVRAVSDTLGVHLVLADKTVARESRKMQVTLVNDGQRKITCGDYYIIAFEDERGIWRELPRHSLTNDIAYIVSPGERHVCKGTWQPDAFMPPVGHYRFYYRVRVDDERKEIWLMTEFEMR